MDENKTNKIKSFTADYCVVCIETIDLECDASAYKRGQMGAAICKSCWAAKKALRRYEQRDRGEVIE